jgi:hypothetical protein
MSVGGFFFQKKNGQKIRKKCSHLGRRRLEKYFKRGGERKAKRTGIEARID